MPLDEIKAALKQLNEEPEYRPDPSDSNVAELLKNRTPITPETLQYKKPRKPSPLFKSLVTYFKIRGDLKEAYDYLYAEVDEKHKGELFHALYSALTQVASERLDPKNTSYDFSNSAARQIYLLDRLYFKKAFLLVTGQDIESNQDLKTFIIKNDEALLFEQLNFEMSAVKKLRQYLLSKKYIKVNENKDQYLVNETRSYFIDCVSTFTVTLLSGVNDRLMRIYFASSPSERMAFFNMPGMQEQVLLMHEIYHKLTSFNEIYVSPQPSPSSTTPHSIKASLSFRRSSSDPMTSLKADEEHIRGLLTKPAWPGKKSEMRL